MRWGGGVPLLVFWPCEKQTNPTTCIYFPLLFFISVLVWPWHAQSFFFQPQYSLLYNSNISTVPFARSTFSLTCFFCWSWLVYLIGTWFRFWSLTLDSGLQSQDLTLDLSWLGIGLRTCSWLGTWLRTCSSWFGNGLGGGGFDLLTWDLFLAWDLTQAFLVLIWDLFILTWDSGLLCFGAWVLTCLSWLWIGFKNSGVVGLGAFLQ